MTKSCRTCKRQLATEADWQAFQDIEECGLSDCPWGADRCWYDNGGACPLPDGPQVREFARRGALLRHRRPLRRVPHECQMAQAS